MPGLGSDYQLVAVPLQLRGEETPEVLLGGAGLGPVVVREVEVRHPEVERARHETAHVREVVVRAEVVPQSERDAREP